MKFYAKGPGNEGFIKNMEVIGYNDLNGIYAFQPALLKTDDGKYYIYYSSFKGRGVNILDVTDPGNPVIVNWLDCLEGMEGNYEAQCTPKVQVADGKLLVALGGGIPPLHGTKITDGNVAGLMIFDISEDPVHPKKLGYWNNTDGFGSQVHRFTYTGGRYVHMAATKHGFHLMIYRILDISDPANPVVVGDWWLEGQARYLLTDKEIKEKYTMSPDGPGFDWPGIVHYPYVDEKNKLAYLSCAGAGFRIVDISDVTAPKTLGALKMCPPFSAKYGGARCHTFMPLGETGYAVGFQEGERIWSQSEESLAAAGKSSFCGIEMFDVSDPTDPTMISIFPYPEVPEGFPYENFNFCGSKLAVNAGPHNIHEPMPNKPGLEMRTDRIYDCYFHAGLRVYDVSDPYVPKEIAYFIPPNPMKTLDSCQSKIVNTFLAETEDVVVDDRGYIYINCSHDGMYVLKCLV